MAAPRPARRGAPTRARLTSARRTRAAGRPRRGPAPNSAYAAASSRFVRVPPGTWPAAISSRTPGRSRTAAKSISARRPGALRQLARVADEAEPGDVGDGVRAGRRARSRRPRRSASSSTRQPRRRPPRPASPRFTAVVTIPVPIGFESTSTSPSRPPRVRPHLVGVHEPGDGHAVLGLGVVDRVPAGDDRARRARPRRRRRAGSRRGAPSAASSGTRRRSARTPAAPPIA